MSKYDKILRWENAREILPPGCFRCLCLVEGNGQGMGSDYQLLSYDRDTKLWYVNDVPGNCVPGSAERLDDWHSVYKWIALSDVIETITSPQGDD